MAVEGIGNSASVVLDPAGTQFTEIQAGPIALASEIDMGDATIRSSPRYAFQKHVFKGFIRDSLKAAFPGNPALF